MTLITKAISALEALTELPCALHACVEMAREAEANRASIRASEAFGAVFPDGPALYHANSQIEELTNELSAANERLARWEIWATFQFAVGPGETDDGTREKISSEIDKLLKHERDKLASVKTELNGWREWASPLARSMQKSVNGNLLSVSESVRVLIDELRAELAREREARRWRKQADEPCPLPWSGQVLADDNDLHADPVVMLVKHLDNAMNWRYLSPGDMP